MAVQCDMSANCNAFESVLLQPEGRRECVGRCSTLNYLNSEVFQMNANNF